MQSGDDSSPQATGRQRCGRKTRSGAPCQAWPVEGSDVCRMHGGGAPQVKAAAARRLELAAAERAAATYGLPLNVAPLDALLGELHRTAGHVAWLGTLVAELEQGQLTQFNVQTGGSSPSVWVNLYQHERAHLAKVARDCLSAGVEERQVRIAEEQGRLVAHVIRRIIAALGLNPAAPEVREVVYRELAALTGEAA